MPLRFGVLLAVIVAWTVPAAFAAEPPLLVKARTLYNGADYDGALEAATEALKLPQWTDPATLVIARTYVERYRQRANPADLAAARDAFGSVSVRKLAPRDQVDHLVGLGQVLYLSDLFGAAAELFDTAISRAQAFSEADRRSLLDWWATALDREAQARPPDRRAAVYDRVAVRMSEELARDPGSAVANYWVAAAARGMGDLDRAWDAAVAAWVRSMLAAVPEASRADLDKLVTEALIPERVRARPVREQEAAAEALRAEWDIIKQQWK